MAKVLLFVHSEKVPVRSQKYPHLNMSRSTTAFPISAAGYLERLGNGRVVKADLDEKELREADERWLKGRVLFVPLAGELYSTRFSEEVESLVRWAENGVSESETGEYSRRLDRLRKEAEAFRERLFQAGSAERLVKIIGPLAEPKSSDGDFPDARSNLKRVTSPEQEMFKAKVTDALIRPMDVGELARELRMEKSNMRKRMGLLTRSGLVKSTTQRLPVGRPRIVYFLSHDI